MRSYELKYGCNPHQKPARINSVKGELPFKILSGNPGYINLMDAMNSWQLVKELKDVLKMPAAASFKHVSPAGAAIGVPLSESLKKAYYVEDMELSPLACAYARARGADRMSSFGDWAALSDIVDVPTAQILKREVSDGVIAPGYTPEALEILKSKKNGKYIVLEIDSDFKPDELEERVIFGVSFEQRRNDRVISFNDVQNIVTKNVQLTQEVKNDLLLSMITLKYTQSNSVCYALGGQIIGCGAGQQSRIHCTRLAGQKADTWYLRQHPDILNLKFKDGISRGERDTAIDLLLQDDITDEEIKPWFDKFEELPRKISKEEKNEWLKTLSGVSLGSDAYFPFRDNIDRAYRSGVRYIIQPGGSIRDDSVIAACDEHNILMIFTGLRLFHH